MGVSIASEYLLPVAITTLQQYAGGAVVAASLSGLVNGYNGNYSGGVFGADPTLGLCEKAGLAVGTALSLNPWKMGKTAVAKIAHSEITNVAIGKMMQKGSKCISFFSKNTAIQSTKKVATNVLEESVEKIAKTNISLAKREAKDLCKPRAVIKETLKGSGDITSQFKLSANEALEAGNRFLGKNYKEIGKPGSGIFRSHDGLRQFRIDANSLAGKHNPWVPHVNLEAFKPNIKDPYINNHILFYD